MIEVKIALVVLVVFFLA